MTKNLGYPKHLIVVEKKIDDLTLDFKAGPKTDRRADIICYSKSENGEIYPLLLIECKAAPEKGALRQVLGYNEIIKAPFVGVAYSGAFRLFWREKEDLSSVDFLPTYEELKGYARVSASDKR